MVVFGTRPEAIKLASVIEALRRRDGCRVTVCSTGQHRELLAPTLADLGIEPDIDLELMSPGQSLSRLFGRAVDAVDTVVAELEPDTVIVQGDTTTVAAASLAGFHRGARIAHVEAGLRTHDRRSPFPEEMNRRIAGVIADWHFAPTQRAADALLRENIDESTILITGNTGIDAVLAMAERARDQAPPPEVESAGRPLVLVTAHRRENFGAPYDRICEAIRTIAERHDDHLFLWPLHLNPNARETAIAHLSEVANIRLTEPLGYGAMVYAMATARLIITDSGGVQEEAPALGTPVLVLRESTERPEAVAAGAAELVGTDKTLIIERATTLLADSAGKREPVMVYGDGKAAERIASVLVDGADVQPFSPVVRPVTMLESRPGQSVRA